MKKVRIRCWMSVMRVWICRHLPLFLAPKILTNTHNHKLLHPPLYPLLLSTTILNTLRRRSQATQGVVWQVVILVAFQLVYQLQSPPILSSDRITQTPTFSFGLPECILIHLSLLWTHFPSNKQLTSKTMTVSTNRVSQVSSTLWVTWFHLQSQQPKPASFPFKSARGMRGKTLGKREKWQLQPK